MICEPTLHNFPNTKPSALCRWCGLTFQAATRPTETLSALKEAIHWHWMIMTTLVLAIVCNVVGFVAVLNHHLDLWGIYLAASLALQGVGLYFRRRYKRAVQRSGVTL